MLATAHTMKYFNWTFRFILFLWALSFALKNTDLVTVRYYLGLEWQAPLVFVLLVTFCLGAFAGVMASLTYVFRQKRLLSQLKKELEMAKLHSIDPSSRAPVDGV
jgi:uncharacterized integral membrane protein